MSDQDPAAPAESPATQKAAVFQDSEFTVEEGVSYKALRTGAIWMNKLFFSSLFLLGVWLLIGYTTGVEGCAGGADGPGTREDVEAAEEGTCSVILSPTAKYLGAMGVLSFLASIAFGALGLVVGKNIIESTRTPDEVGAEERGGGDGPPGPLP